jgi:hypothetical protein
MGEGVLQTLRRSMYCTHDLNMLKLLYRRCAILTSSSNPPKWTLQLLWDCVFCVVGGFPFSSSPSLSFFVFVADRVPVLGIKKPVAQNVLQPSPRTPNFNVEVVGPREYTGHGEYKPVSAMAHVEALSTLKLGGAGGSCPNPNTFHEQAFIFPTPEPYQQQKQRKTQTWRGGKGKAAHNTKPKTTRKSVRHVQLDLSIHVLGTLPKIPYPDTKVFSLAAAWGSTCFLNI